MKNDLLWSDRERMQMQTELDRLRAENERLRAALHRIGLPRAQITYCRDEHEEAVLLARATLEGK